MFIVIVAVVVAGAALLWFIQILEDFFKSGDAK